MRAGPIGIELAVEAALRCWRAGAQVTLSYRRAGFDPGSVKRHILGDIQTQIKKGNINMLAAASEHASWGYFDYRIGDEGLCDGYQSVPVDWTISSPRKRAFFGLLVQVTGASRGPQHSGEESTCRNQ